MGGKKKKRKRYTGRDLAFVALLQGATKASVHLDHKKEEDRLKARAARFWEEEEDLDEEDFFDEECDEPLPLEDDKEQAHLVEARVRKKM
mgnify:CR=1 FL=1